MSIQSLGVGSGLALDDLVKQLLEAERKPKTDRLDAREEKNEAELSGLGQLKSKLSDFKDAVDELRRDTDISGREPVITDPDADTSIITAEAANSALTGDYEIAVSQLASGSRIITNDGDFASSSDSVLSAGSGSGSLTFKIGNTGDTFSINVAEGTTLAQLREQINNDENNFGVKANIIETGTAAGAKLVFTSEITGTNNDLTIVNDNDLADLERLATTNSLEAATYLVAAENAKNAIATIDGLTVQSATNEFENTIQNVSFTAERESPFDTDGTTRRTSTLSIGFDREGLDGKIRDFVDNFNNLISEIKTLTKYGESDLEEDGALAGDALARGIQNTLTGLVGENVSASKLGGLFQLGIELDEDGKLEIGSVDFGLGSGEDRLKEAMDDNFDEIAKLFTDSEEGIAVRLYETLKLYTDSGGLLQSRERNAKDERDRILDDRAALELRLLSTEQILRDKYLNLDLTVARLNQTGSALLAALG
ncbi:flagellar hook protein [Alteromonas sediminis]|uniref:Flagellar hook-associated protein 2 n=1 Tax=Alteromonas sediminis TaxID=2259342 RepID=A0A3N5XYH6_9ALTE|nr:flagellar filament capping protein FliD [Alteromonas sediminis]RPJ64966.1 flagellar hook protein [Alteromonas sediminis]